MGLIAEYPNKLVFTLARLPNVLLTIHYLRNRCTYIIYMYVVIAKAYLTYVNSRPFALAQCAAPAAPWPRTYIVRELASGPVVLGMLATLARESFVLSLCYQSTYCKFKRWRWLENHMFTPATIIYGNIGKRTPRSRHPHNLGNAGKKTLSSRTPSTHRDT